jgi:glutathione reductase (NADPH)
VISSAEPFDLVVLGTGAGGAGSASKCRAAGWRVAVVDDLPYGGTCALRGCDPKKVLVGAADAVAWNRRMVGHGITGGSRIEWPALMSFKRTFTDPVPRNREKTLIEAGIVTLHGEAGFVGEDRLVVGDHELSAKHVVIATGSGPRPLGVPGADLITSSTEFLELDSLPGTIAFVGAGYISLEFAHLSHRAGASVVVIGRGKPLRGFETTLVERLVNHSRLIGIDIRTDTEVTSIERTPGADGFRVHVRNTQGDSFIEADLVVHGAGRVPNTARLGADAGRVRLDQRGAVEVNEFLQSPTNSRVYAAGDVALQPGSLPLTPVAAHEGAVVASNLLHGNHKRPDYRGISSVVFTLPPLAGVGLTEKAAHDAGLRFRVETGDTTEWLSNRRVLQPAGMYKTIIDAETDRVLGAHLLGTHSEEIINLFALAIRFGVRATELKQMIFAYPTSASDLPFML